ncbi:MAG: polymerase subunit sigma-24 [Paenibacillus sp.]|nr:polymerase subunit sigma-24 [Paenibacillus sp.]
MEHEPTDGSLIERARAGDRDAFGELVRRHRTKAFDWARNVARDPHLAEDIVQEALLRAFMHLGTLADMNRFLGVKGHGSTGLIWTGTKPAGIRP